MITRILWTILLFLLLTTAVYPQDGENDITYGEIIEGEITDEQPAITYTFTGTAGDIIAVEMLSVNRDLDNPLETPVMRLRSENEAIIADTTLSFALDDAFFIVELPSDGTYYLTVTRDSTVPTLATGKFTLTVDLVPELTAEELFASRINNDDFGQYVYIRPESAFSIDYSRKGGEFAPAVTLNRLVAERDGLEPIAEISGREVTEARLGVFPVGDVYVVMVSQALFSFYLQPVFADYELRLVPETER